MKPVAELAKSFVTALVASKRRAYQNGIIKTKHATGMLGFLFDEVDMILRTVFRFALVVLLLDVGAGCLNGQDKVETTIQLQAKESLLDGQKNRGAEVKGLSHSDLEAIKKLAADSRALQTLFLLRVGKEGSPILGKVHFQDQRLLFEPRFPLDDDVYYFASFNFSALSGEYAKMPPLEQRLTSKIGFLVQIASHVSPKVYPNQSSLPQNVLRMYLQFNVPMSQVDAYDHIKFLDDRGKEMLPPFLNIPQALWSRDGKRLTLLFDPGRIKRGLVPNKELGYPFQVGKTYTVVISKEWTPMPKMFVGKEHRHTFTITEPDRVQPSVDRWSVQPPKPNTKQPLTVQFGEPLDEAMLGHSIQIKSKAGGPDIPGKIEVADDGESWTFTPEKPWPAGKFILAANPRLEDRAGNSLAQPFERKISDGETKAEELPKPITELGFNVGSPQTDRPNVVVILADDLGWRDLSCQGSEFYESPNIDRISNEGMRFDFAYAACQVCSPSRAAIMTGKSPARLKITDYIGAPSGTDWKRNTKLLPAFYKRNLPAEETTLAEAFQEGGYKTFFAGKWHLGSKGSFPEDHGFEVNIGGHLAGTPPGGYFVPYKNPKMKDGLAGECLPVRLGQETAEFIEANQKVPFFAFLSFYSVHGPIQSTEALWNKYREKADGMDEIKRPNRRFIIDRTMPVRQIQDHPLYAGMVESMDDGVGRVLDTLDRLGLAENTIVIFTSDNGGVSSGDGYATSNLPLRGGKGRQWEGGVREPLFVRWPNKVAAGSSCDTPVIGTDIYPTLLDLTSLPTRPRQTLDGVSIRPLLEGNSIEARPLVWHYPHYGNQGGEPASMIRKGDWKLIRYHEDQRVEFYNLTDDPSEETDVAPRHANRVAEMSKQLDQHLATMDAEKATDNPNFNAEAYKQWQDQMRLKRMPTLDKNHARFRATDFKPNGGWWEQRSNKSNGK